MAQLNVTMLFALGAFSLILSVGKESISIFAFRLLIAPISPIILSSLLMTCMSLGDFYLSKVELTHVYFNFHGKRLGKFELSKYQPY